MTEKNPRLDEGFNKLRRGISWDKDPEQDKSKSETYLERSRRIREGEGRYIKESGDVKDGADLEKTLVYRGLNKRKRFE